MINKPIATITIGDIQQLVENAVAESRTIEYKRDLPGTSADEIKEFLADVSSFANTEGGDLIFGVSEEDGAPKEILGIAELNEDATKQRFENLFRVGIEPRLQCDLRVISRGDSDPVVIVRIKRSWLAPHRVIYRSQDKFYARNSVGKYPMDTQELRTAFTVADRVTLQISAFVRRRLGDLAANDTPIPFVPGPKTVLHLIPLEAMSLGTAFPVLTDGLGHQSPIYTNGWDDRINLDGRLTYWAPGRDHLCRTYTQFYRNGIIEAVEGSLVKKDDKRIPSLTFEEEFLKGVGGYMALMRELGVSPPVNIRLGLLGVRGIRMGVEEDPDAFRVREFDRDNIILSDGMIDDLGQPANDIMRPLFNLIWNACGYSRSPYFDESGKWVGRERR